jgi:hypothetical protein
MVMVTIHVPDQPPIETRLTEGDNRRTLCAIARLSTKTAPSRWSESTSTSKASLKWTKPLTGDFAGAPVLNNVTSKDLTMSFSTKLKVRLIPGATN